MAALIAAFATAFAGRNPFRARAVTPWSSASPGVDRGVGYTSSGYANPVRNVLANVLLTRTALLEVEDEPADPEVAARRYTYRIDVIDVVEQYFYRPLTRGVLVISRTAKAAIGSSRRIHGLHAHRGAGRSRRGDSHVMIRIGQTRKVRR